MSWANTASRLVTYFLVILYLIKRREIRLAGKEIARGLAQQGLTVLLGARDDTRGEAAAAELQGDGKVIFLKLDVTDDASIQAAVRRVEAEFSRLDILVNNSGDTFYSRKSCTTLRMNKPCQMSSRPVVEQKGSPLCSSFKILISGRKDWRMCRRCCAPQTGGPRHIAGFAGVF